MDLTVSEAVTGALSFNGQRCTALKIFYVHASRTEEFLAKFSEAIAAASEEQSAASEEINRSIVEVNEVSQLTAEAMKQASTAVADLTEQAKKLAALIQEMKQG